MFDPLGRRAEEYCYRAPAAGGGLAYLAGADMAGQPLYHVNADGGARRGLVNVAGAADPRAGTPAATPSAWSTTSAQRPTRRYISTGGAAGDPDRAVGLRRGPGGGESVRPPVPALRHGRVLREQPVRLQGEPARQCQAARGRLSAGGRLDAAGRPDRPPLQLDAAAAAAGLVPSGDGGRDRFTATAPSTTR